MLTGTVWFSCLNVNDSWKPVSKTSRGVHLWFSPDSSSGMTTFDVFIWILSEISESRYFFFQSGSRSSLSQWILHETSWLRESLWLWKICGCNRTLSRLEERTEQGEGLIVQVPKPYQSDSLRKRQRVHIPWKLSRTYRHNSQEESAPVIDPTTL